MGKIASGIFGGDDSAKDAAGVQAQAARDATREQRRQFNITRRDLSPFLQAGTGALEQEQALLGLAGQSAQQEALEDFSLRPDQQFLQQEGERALLRNQAAIGGLGGGNVRRELTQFGQGVASQALSEQLNRLASLRGGGQTVGTNLGQFGAQAASNIGQGLQQAGAAQASGILGAQQARANQFSTLAGLASMFSDKRLKKNIRKLGELESGLAWYSWEWNDKGKELSGCSYGEGVIAQEVQEKFPEAVHEKDGYLSVDYSMVA